MCTKILGGFLCVCVFSERFYHLSMHACRRRGNPCNMARHCAACVQELRAKPKAAILPLPPAWGLGPAIQEFQNREACFLIECFIVCFSLHCMVIQLKLGNVLANSHLTDSF